MSVKPVPFSVTHPNGMTVRGTLYPAQTGTGRRPAVIVSHGFNGVSSTHGDRGEAFSAAGIHCFTFDFRGGSIHTTSDGKIGEMMSLDTEKADLQLVTDYVLSRTDVDPDNLFLMGDSQGGMVSVLTAGSSPLRYRALVLWFPALMIPEDSCRRIAEGRHEVFGIPICPEYDTVAAATDPWQYMPDYQGKVLILQGDADPVVPVAIAQKAAALYPHSELIIIPGAGHGFVGADLEQALAASAAHLLSAVNA